MLRFIDDNDQRIVLGTGPAGDQITIDVSAGEIRIKAQTRIVIDAPQVELGEHVSQPLVLGGGLMLYLNQLVAQS